MEDTYDAQSRKEVQFEEKRECAEKRLKFFDTTFVIVCLLVATIPTYKLIGHLWLNERPFLYICMALLFLFVVPHVARGLYRKICMSYSSR